MGRLLKMSILCCAVTRTNTTLADAEIGLGENGRSLKPLMNSVANSVKQYSGERESFTKGELIFCTTNKDGITFACCADISAGASRTFLFLDDIVARFSVQFLGNVTVFSQVNQFSETLRQRMLHLSISSPTIRSRPAYAQLSAQHARAGFNGH